MWAVEGPGGEVALRRSAEGPGRVLGAVVLCVRPARAEMEDGRRLNINI